MQYVAFDETRPLDLILLGRITIDFNPAYTVAMVRGTYENVRHHIRVFNCAEDLADIQ